MNYNTVLTDKPSDLSLTDNVSGWDKLAGTDYPKVWPFPTESLATQEETDESALHASLRSLAEAKQIPAKFRRFC
jgi:hypothetical protein